MVNLNIRLGDYCDNLRENAPYNYKVFTWDKISPVGEVKPAPRSYSRMCVYNGDLRAFQN